MSTAAVYCPSWCSHHSLGDGSAPAIHRHTITVGEDDDAVSVDVEYAPGDRSIEPIGGPYVMPEQYVWLNGAALGNFIEALQKAKELIEGKP